MRKKSVTNGVTTVRSMGALLALLAVPAAAAGQRCEPEALRPWLGIGAFSCDGGVCTVLGATARPGGSGGPDATFRDRAFDYEFTVEPTLWDIAPEGPAAGRLRDEDVLVAVNDRVITSVAASRELEELRVGEPVRLLVRRDGRLVEEAITPRASCAAVWVTFEAARRLAEANSASNPTERTVPPSGEGRRLGPAFLGVSIRCGDCTLELLTGHGRPSFRFGEYPAVVDVLEGSPADSAGLRPGDRLTHVGGDDVRSQAGAERLSRLESRSGEEIQVRYLRGDQAMAATVVLQ